MDGCYTQGYGLIGYQNGKIRNRDGKNGKTDQNKKVLKKSFVLCAAAATVVTPASCLPNKDK